MIGIVTDYAGKRTALPAFLQWSVKRTDGEPCDSFSVQFACGKKTASKLEGATEFQAVEAGKVVFTGIVDDFELRLGRDGALAEITGRGMAGRLMDMQVPAAEYVTAQLEDILNAYVRPCGITKIEAVEMPPVQQFVVQTGTTCYQALAGFCRHSADIFPRFLADGTLVLRKMHWGSRLGSEMRFCRRSMCSTATVWRQGRCSSTRETAACRRRITRSSKNLAARGYSTRA